jgi:hypothetical protein
MPTGSGKTRTAARLAHTAVERGRRVLWVAHTTELVQQAQAVLTGVDVCTIQSKPTGSYDLVIVDECIPGNSIVGDKPARTVEIGDFVQTPVGPRKVESVKTRKVSSIIRINDSFFSDNHPILTVERGYVEAGCVKIGEHVLTLRNSVQGKILHRSMPHEASQPRTPSKNKRNVSSRSPRQSIGETSRDGAQAENSRRKRDSADLGDGSTRATRFQLGIGKGRSDRYSKRQWLSYVLQVGLGAQDFETWCRTRRQLPFSTVEKRTGSKKRHPFTTQRVDSTEILEQGIHPEFERRCPEGIVYSFQVESPHVFYADGILTHNCHHFSNNQFSGRVRDIPYRIGLTATPQRADGSPMEDLFDTIIAGPSIKTLTDSGILVPAEVIRPEKYIKGLAMDPIAAYDRHCAGRKAIIYTASVKHALELEARDKRIVAVYGSMPAQARRRAFQSHKSGEVPILVNCLIATEGYDDPSVSAIIIARSVGSLSLYLQIIGRGIRRSEGKTDCLVVDLRGVSHMHGDYMQDLEFSLDGEGIKRVGGASGLCPICSSVLVSGVCPGCGREPDEMELPKVLNLKLDKFAHKRAQPEAVKISDLAYYMVQARVRGYSMYWALKKFEGIHGHPPPQTWIQKAKQRIGK